MRKRINSNLVCSCKNKTTIIQSSEEKHKKDIEEKSKYFDAKWKELCKLTKESNQDS